MPPPQLAPPGMPPQMPQQMLPGQGMNPHGGSELPCCPMCGQMLPLPFNNTNAPNAPLPMPQEMGGMAGGIPPGMGGGQMSPQDSQLLMALLGGQGGPPMM